MEKKVLKEIHMLSHSLSHLWRTTYVRIHSVQMHEHYHFYDSALTRVDTGVYYDTHIRALVQVYYSAFIWVYYGYRCMKLQI